MNSSPPQSNQSSNTNSEPNEQPSGKPKFQLNRIPEKYWALGAMVLWGAGILFFGLIRLDSYAMDEGGAMALLLAWSVAEHVVIPVTVLGGPDFRALFFWPVALYWPGSMLAAKIFTLMVMFGGAYALYRWSRSTYSDEVALIATGLLLITPLAVLQIDSVASAPFLLGAFGLGIWLDKKYRASPHAISSWYFLQLILVAATVTLHPMGLAYPLALAWRWQAEPKSQTQKKQVWLGLGITSVIVLVMQLGWIDIPWLANPLAALHQGLMSVNEMDPGSSGQWAGVLLGVILAVILLRDYRALTDNLMGSMLLAAALIGLLAADRNWAVIAMVVVLYRGFPLLIELNKKMTAGGFLGQRGLAFIALLGLTILFMQGDKRHAQFIQSEILPPVDELIRTLAQEAQDPEQPFLAASQWPARTMLVTRRDALHLPPPRDNGKELLQSIKGVTHVVFDHRSPENDALNRNLSAVTGFTQTLAIQQAGVIIKIKNEAPEDQNDMQHSKSDDSPEPATVNESADTRRPE